MEAEFKKDLRHSYMVITKDDSPTPPQYCIGMLEHQPIDGILPLELRRLDDQVFYYYEITAKQTMSNVLERTSLSGSAFRQLFQGIMDIVEKAYEYLLPEDGFILSPEFIYLDITKYKPFLCYLPGSPNNIKRQMNSLLEYLMNKIDYTDKDAVLLVYQLYAVSREEDFTFDRLTEVLQKDLPEERRAQVSRRQSLPLKDNKTDNQTDQGNELPEQEVLQKLPGGSKEVKNSIASQKSIQKQNIICRKNTSNKIADNKTANNKTSSKKFIINKVINNKITSENLKSSENDNPSKNQYLSDKLPIHRLTENATEENILQHYPLMKEKIESETEVLYYPIQNLILSGFCILIGILITILTLTSGILYNSFGNRLDYSKLLALILIVLCAESYTLKKLLDKKNKIAKIVKTLEYIDPRTNFEMKGIRSWRKLKPHISDDEGEDEPYEQSAATEAAYHEALLRESIDQPIKENNKNMEEGMLTEKEAQKEIRKLIRYQEELTEEEDDNPTCLLNTASVNYPNIILKALDSNSDRDIIISEFPFFIGKLHKNMSYRLDKDVISRYHAKITKEENQYYVTDLNSSNGTTVNGESLLPYQCKEVKPGDEIAFANISFRVVRR